MIAERLREIWAELPEGVRLVAVSKFHPAEALQEAYDAGQRIFGESRVQELTAKRLALPADIKWHFIGHLQRNKVRQIAGFVSLIHSCDSVELLREIDRQGALAGRRIDCLLELHVAQEESKFGFSEEALTAFLEAGEWRSMQHVRICGLMCMASLTDDEAQIRREFRSARRCFEQARERYFAGSEAFCELSMGMSHDYALAVEEGSTLVRIGTSIFGERTAH